MIPWGIAMLGIVVSFAFVLAITKLRYTLNENDEKDLRISQQSQELADLKIKYQKVTSKNTRQQLLAMLEQLDQP